MRRGLLVVLVVLGLPWMSRFSFAETIPFQAAANRLVALQNTDGGWDDPLDLGDRSAPGSMESLAQIGIGLAKAYNEVRSQNYRLALENVGSLLLTKKDNFRPCDGLLAKQLDGIFGGSTYSSFVKSQFYDKLEAGEYSEFDITYSGVPEYTASYADAFYGTNAVWYLGMSLASAKAVGVTSTSEWCDGVKMALGQIDSLQGPGSYETRDLAAGIYGLTMAGERNFAEPLEGRFSGITTVTALADELLTLQLTSGGFKADKVLGAGSESIDGTACALLALTTVGGSKYKTAVQGAAAYVRLAQLGTGGWENELGSGESNAMTGMAVLGLAAVPEPSVAVLLVNAGLMAAFWGCWWRRKCSDY
jgi:hypothetical protein